MPIQEVNGLRLVRSAKYRLNQPTDNSRKVRCRHLRLPIIGAAYLTNPYVRTINITKKARRQDPKKGSLGILGMGIYVVLFTGWRTQKAPHILSDHRVS